ncbi:MAG: hypothetical protein F6K53_34320 [Moorea sp. SIO4A1]|nr:hypothetical protein [Moorena sp. SIO4A1]
MAYRLKLSPMPYSRFPIPDSRFDRRAQLAPSGHCEYWDDWGLTLA